MDMGLCRAAWRSLVSLSGARRCSVSRRETMRFSRKVFAISLLGMAAFGLVYLMLFNILPPVLHSALPPHNLRQSLHRETSRHLARPAGAGEGPGTGKEALAESPALQGAEKSSTETGKGVGGTASPFSENSTVMVEASLKEEKEKKKEEEGEDTAEDRRDTVSGGEGKLQGQKTGADRAQDLGGDHRTGPDGGRAMPQRNADRAERALQDQRKGADSAREVGQGQRKGGQGGDVRDQKTTGREGRTVPQDTEKGLGEASPVQTQTSDHWPVFSKDYFPKRIPPSPFHPNFTIRWDFNTSDFLQRPDVKGQPPKLITWMAKTRYMMPLPEPVRLRVCPEMPCRLTTNQTYRKDSAALLWAGQIMSDPHPPKRPHPDQVFVFHNHEPQTPNWIYSTRFRKREWRSAFNWTMHYRSDSDIVSLYGRLVKRDRPLSKNYSAIVGRKSKMAAWLVSHCSTHGQRERYVTQLREHMQVDAYGDCSRKGCPRRQDDVCFSMISQQYKFFLAFENAFCRDFISEKFFRYLEADAVVVARGSNQYRDHAPPGIFINTADFQSPKELADYLLHLDRHPEDYIQLLKAKDSYQPLYEDWPIRGVNGGISFMIYRYESVPYCEMCRRLWDLDKYRQTIPDIVQWFDKGNCQPPKDLGGERERKKDR